MWISLEIVLKSLYEKMEFPYSNCHFPLLQKQPLSNILAFSFTIYFHILNNIHKILLLDLFRHFLLTSVKVDEDVAFALLIF